MFRSGLGHSPDLYNTIIILSVLVSPFFSLIQPDTLHAALSFSIDGRDIFTELSMKMPGSLSN